MRRRAKPLMCFWFCSLVKGITPQICLLCFVLINSILWNLLCVWISFENASSHFCFIFVFFFLSFLSNNHISKRCKHSKDAEDANTNIGTLTTATHGYFYSCSQTQSNSLHTCILQVSDCLRHRANSVTVKENVMGIWGWVQITRNRRI